jgi:hypothetical protein
MSSGDYCSCFGARFDIRISIGTGASDGWRTILMAKSFLFAWRSAIVAELYQPDRPRGGGSQRNEAHGMCFEFAGKDAE